jgi:hypothetical protein
MVGFSPAVTAARARRAARSGQSSVEFESFVEDVSKRIDLTLRQRVTIAVNYLQGKIVKNISVPVTKVVIGKRVRVTERSKPGEFPRADTTQLMKTVFCGVTEDGPGAIMGYVGTPLSYGLELETTKDRRFLTRTLDEERETVVKILTGPVT